MTKEENTRQNAVALRESEPGLSGREIAKLLGVTEGRISQILGKRREVKIEVPVEEQSK